MKFYINDNSAGNTPLDSFAPGVGNKLAMTIDGLGTVTAPFFVGDGSGLTGVTASAVNFANVGGATVAARTNNNTLLIGPTGSLDINGAGAVLKSGGTAILDNAQNLTSINSISTGASTVASTISGVTFTSGAISSATTGTLALTDSTVGTTVIQATTTAATGNNVGVKSTVGATTGAGIALWGITSGAGAFSTGVQGQSTVATGVGGLFFNGAGNANVALEVLNAAATAATFTVKSSGDVNGTSFTSTATPGFSGDGSGLTNINAAGLTLAGDVTGLANANKVVKIQNYGVSATAPTAGQALVGTGAAWAPANVVNSITGTANQVIVGGTAFIPVLSLPQSIDTAANVTFGTVAATTFTGALTGNANTATKLQTARNINGVAFDGTSNITVTADANTLTNTTLNSTVVTSSLTSVGTLTGLTMGGNIAMGTNNITGTGTFNGSAFNAAATLNGAVSVPGVNVTQTWNNVTTAFKGIFENITNTTSAAGSRLIDLQVGGTSKFSVDAAGNIIGPGAGTISGYTFGGNVAFNNITGGTNTTAAMVLGSGSSLSALAASTATVDFSGAANTAPVRTGVVLPTGNKACATKGELYVNTSPATAGQEVYVCTGVGTTVTATWALVGDGAGNSTLLNDYAHTTIHANSSAPAPGPGISASTGAYSLKSVLLNNNQLQVAGNTIDVLMQGSNNLSLAGGANGSVLQFEVHLCTSSDCSGAGADNVLAKWTPTSFSNTPNTPAEFPWQIRLTLTAASNTVANFNNIEATGTLIIQTNAQGGTAPDVRINVSPQPMPLSINQPQAGMYLVILAKPTLNVTDLPVTTNQINIHQLQ